MLWPRCGYLAGCVVVISDDGIEAGTEAHWDGSSRGDSELAVRVRDALKADALLQDSDFKVSVQDGVVTLRGTVKGTERFDRAVQLAKASDPRLLELSCEKEESKHIALLSSEVVAVQTYEKSAMGGGSKRPGFSFDG